MQYPSFFLYQKDLEYTGLSTFPQFTTSTICLIEINGYRGSLLGENNFYILVFGLSFSLFSGSESLWFEMLLYAPRRTVTKPQLRIGKQYLILTQSIEQSKYKCHPNWNLSPSLQLLMWLSADCSEPKCLIWFQRATKEQLRLWYKAEHKTLQKDWMKFPQWKKI